MHPTAGKRQIKTLATAAMLALPAVGLAQTNASWTSAVSGNWSTSGNWTPATPPNAGGNATFALATAGTTATLDIAVTLGGINFVANNYTLGPGAGSITLNSGAAVDVATGNTATISALVHVASNNFSKTGAGTLVLSGNNNLGGNIQVNNGVLRVTTPGALGGASLNMVATASTGIVELNNVGSVSSSFLGLGVAAPSAPAGTVRSVGNNTWNGAWFIVQPAAVVGVPNGADTLTLNGPIIDSNAPTVNGLTKEGPGTFAVDNLRLSGALALNAGTIRVKQNGTTTGTSKLTSLNIAGGATPTARLDLTDNDLVLDYTGGSPISTVRAQIKSAYAGGAWTGQGISTTLGGLIGAGSFTGKNAGLGYAEATAIGSPTTFSGQSVDATAVIVKYTFQGDANLDGDADGVDIGTWATNFSGELSGGAGATLVWTQGDWDYDGDVDGVDAGLWATSFTGELSGAGLGSVVVASPLSPEASTILQSLGVTVVPEPGTLGALAAVGLGLLGRRRNRPSGLI